MFTVLIHLFKRRKKVFKYNIIPTVLAALARQGNTQYAFTLPTVVVISTNEYNITLSAIKRDQRNVICDISLIFPTFILIVPVVTGNDQFIIHNF